MQRKLSHTTALIFLTTVVQGSAMAALYAVDPGPYQPEFGYFASWYQDTHGRVAELCLSKNVSSRVAGAPGAPAFMCSIPAASDEFNPDLPIEFPGNFPDEAFWFTADASIVDATTGIDLDFGAAIEAAFAAEAVNEGDQISFARIRIRVDVPTPGIYTITHPYGVEVFNVTPTDFGTDGNRAINMTRDVGMGAPKTYDGALRGDVGPFLRSVKGPYTEANPKGGTDTFIGDPNLLEEVTGSPFNTNYVRIEGPGGIDVRTNLFSITGKLSKVQLPTPLITQRSTYSRQTVGGGVVAQEDVFMLAPPPPGTAKFASGDQTIGMIEANATGNWYGQSAINPALPKDLQLTADNQAAITTSTPTTRPAKLVDLVTIDRAEYSLSSGDVTIAASTSDRTSPPALVATTGHGATIGTMAGSGPNKTLTTGISLIPPARVTVTSANGGTDTEEVVIVP
ncbi:hypothetical protein D3C85_837620 [compost metagenome]